VIVDTNALSDYADDVPGAIAAFKAAQVVAIPVIVLGEYRFGIAQSNRRIDYEKWLAGFLKTSQILEISNETTHWYAGVRLDLRRTGKPIPSNDMWIAALSRQHGLPVLSKDRHFDRVQGIERIPW
jgi:predicted nucleic acid-binding protein